MKWMEFLMVAGTTLGCALALVSVFSLGIRFSVTADRRLEAGEPAGLRRSAAMGCFALCAAGVLAGIYLIIPYFSR